MVNIIGAMLTGIACGYLGLKKCMDMKKRVKSLEDITSSLEMLEGEISFSQNKLAKAFSNSDRNGLFKDVSKYIKDGVCAAEAIDTAADKNREPLCLNGGDIDAVKTLGQNIGKTDVNEQIKHIRYVSSLIKNRIGEARGEYTRLGRVYGIGGILCGLMLVIILI